MMSQNDLCSKLKERIKIWNITFLLSSSVIFIYLVISETLGYTNIELIRTARIILYLLFALPMGVSMELQIALNLVKEHKEDSEDLE